MCICNTGIKPLNLVASVSWCTRSQCSVCECAYLCAFIEVVFSSCVCVCVFEGSRDLITFSCLFSGCQHWKTFPTPLQMLLSLSSFLLSAPFIRMWCIQQNMCERLTTSHTCQYDTHHYLPHASLNSIRDRVAVLKAILKNNIPE